MESVKSLATSESRDGQPRVRCKPVERNQLLLRTVDVEKLVGPSHAVRALWELVGDLDLQPYCAEIAALEGRAGRPVWSPQVLISLWLYAYKDGISSAREIERRCEYHPAYQGLTGMEVVNYHTLADFRTAHEAALDQLFIEVLGVLSHQGLITLRRVMHDGTKIKAAASDRSFHRKATLEDHLKRAEEQVKAMGDPHGEKLSPRRAKAKERALGEKQKRLRQALQELEQLEEARSKAENNGEKKQLRVSSTDPEARVMLGAKGSYGPGYNVQISTDAKAKIIVGVGVTSVRATRGNCQPRQSASRKTWGKSPSRWWSMVPTRQATRSAKWQTVALT